MGACISAILSAWASAFTSTPTAVIPTVSTSTPTADTPTVSTSIPNADTPTVSTSAFTSTPTAVTPTVSTSIPNADTPTVSISTFTSTSTPTVVTPTISTSIPNADSPTVSTSAFTSIPTSVTPTVSTSTPNADTPTVSTSTAVNPPTNSCFDIFLSHRGPDTKNNFASLLYRRLVSFRYLVFWDKEEMRVGDTIPSQIQAAIENASVHVALFSPKYAESRWCLEELHLMVESRKPIIPVFYNVQPTELRWTHGGKGVYARALTILEGKKRTDGQLRFDSATVQKWRDALSTVAEISGLELEKFNGDEGELLDQVVESVLRKAKRTEFDVGEYPTGLEEKIQDFENRVLFQQQSDELQVIGIVGLGGIGKTTLAQEFFNKKSSNYHRSSFLSDIRSKNPLESLQKKLIKDLTGNDVQIETDSEGKVKLRNYLSSCHALVILDNVDHENQLEVLLRPMRTALQSDSLVLITCRDRDVLRRSKLVQASSIYQLTGLNSQQSKELFCLNAFNQRRPLQEFEDLVEKYLITCNGLPLSLKVLGALLYDNHDRSFWIDNLVRLSQILPDEIEKRLLISYEALKWDERAMFLDIACFFIGKKKDTPITIWEGSGWKGSLGFRSLQNKNLVEVDIKNKITMHDHLKDLGRQLAKDRCLPRRIWRREDMDELMQQSSEATEVRGISLGRRNNGDPSLSGCKMKGLQLLDIDDYGKNNKDLENILKAVQSPNLIWLRWCGSDYTLPSLPSCIPMNKLRVLTVKRIYLDTLWQEESQAPLQLRKLKIYRAIRYIPESIGMLKHLEWFRINVSSLPDSFGCLTNLQHINLSGSELKRLPDSFGNLINLQHIDLSGCPMLKLPDSFGNLTRLKHLDLRGCFDLSDCVALSMSSETLGSISTLEYLFLSCTGMEVLPPQVAHQRFLKELALRFPSLTGLPSDIGELRNLKKLHLSGCHKLKCLPDSLGGLNQLTELTILECPGLVEVGTLPDALVELYVVSTRKLRKIKALYNLAKLRKMSIFYCYELEELPSVEALVSLEHIKIGKCVKLRSISGLARLTKLRVMGVRECSELKELVGVEHVSSLERLVIFECPNLQLSEGVDPKIIVYSHWLI